MTDHLQHPALLAWLHACELTDHMDAVFDIDTKGHEWAEVHNCADNLRQLYSKEIPPEVREAYQADCLQKEDKEFRRLVDAGTPDTVIGRLMGMSRERVKKLKEASND